MSKSDRPAVADARNALAKNFEEFDEFQRTHTGQEVEEAAERGAFVFEGQAAFMHWQRGRMFQAAEARRAAEAEDALKLHRRSVVASELSARAAVRSAQWSGWALFISIAALAVAGWPFIKELWQ